MLEITESNIQKLRDVLNRTLRQKREDGYVTVNSEDKEVLQLGFLQDFNKIGLLSKLGMSQSILPDISNCCLYGIYVGYKTSFIVMDGNYKFKVRSRATEDEIVTSVLEADRFYSDFMKSIGQAI